MSEEAIIEKWNKGLLYAIIFVFGMDVGLMIAIIMVTIF